MKLFKYLVFLIVVVSACDSTKNTTPLADVTSYDSLDQTNDFYDNAPTFKLQGPETIMVTGELEHPGEIKLADLPLKSVIVKETKLEGNEVSFVGAYRYDGISVSEILSGFKLAKKNAGEFEPIIDLYVVVYNEAGDSVVISWGELFYPVHRHEIIVATQVMRIVPSKTKDLWPLAEHTRLVIGSDLITARNIGSPVRIDVRSINRTFKVDREVDWWAPEMGIYRDEDLLVNLTSLPDNLTENVFDQVFYGRGRGIHGITPFRGAYLKDLLAPYFPLSEDMVKNVLFVFAAIDGYRCAVTWAEIFNRNDRAELFIIDKDNYENAGKFSSLFSADYFSDRAVKSMTEIRLVKP